MVLKIGNLRSCKEYLKLKIMKFQGDLLNVKCGGCVKSITKSVGSIDGVSEVHVDLENATIEFEAMDSSILDLVKHKLESLGYPMDEEHNSIFKKAKSYVSCAIGRMD